MTSYSECMGEFGWDARYEAERNKRERIQRLRPDEPCGYHPACLSHHTKPCEGCGRIAGRLPATEGSVNRG